MPRQSSQSGADRVSIRWRLPVTCGVLTMRVSTGTRIGPRAGPPPGGASASWGSALPQARATGQLSSVGDRRNDMASASAAWRLADAAVTGLAPEPPWDCPVLGLSNHRAR